MHAFKAKGGTLFHHNSDLSGKVIVADGLGAESHAPAADLLEFAEFVTRRRRPSPLGKPQFEERLRELPKARNNVAGRIERLRSELEAGGGLTPYDRQVFQAAIDAARKAR